MAPKESYPPFDLANNKQFCLLKTNNERIVFILNYVKSLHVFREEVFVKVNEYKRYHQKCAEKSRSFASEGKVQLQNKEYNSAVSSFTQAILSAPFPSEHNGNNELYSAHALRCVAFSLMKDYSNALFDTNASIDLLPTIEMFLQKIDCLNSLDRFTESLQLIDELIAKANSYEINLKHWTVDNLKEIKQKIIQKVDKNYEKGVKNEELKEIKNNFWIHPNCELRKSQRKGRYAVAKDLIPKNTVVMVEKPQVFVLFDENTLTHCCNCGKNIGLQIYPCVGCDEVVFCDRRCFDEAFEQFHKFECGFSGHIYSYSSALLLVFRMFAKIGYKNVLFCEQNVSQNGFEINQYLYNERQQTVPEIYKTQEEKLVEFQFMTSLLHHNEKRNKHANIFHTYRAIETALLMEYSNQLEFDVFEDINSFVELTNVVVLNMRRILTNVFGWFEYSKERIHVGNCHCSVSALVNHSCEPNIYWKFVNGNLTFKAVKNIKANEEIKVTYGPTAGSRPFSDRQSHLKKSYFFTCNCSGCLRECKDCMSLRCLSCDGPVVYTLNTKQNSCLLCETNYEDIEFTIERVESHKRLFRDMITNMEWNHNLEYSEMAAQMAIDVLVEFLHRDCKILLDYIRELIRIYAKLRQFGKAVKYSKYLLPSIDGNDNNWEDLLLLTNNYYMYLKEEPIAVNTEWETCFQLYSKLIDLLKKLKDSMEMDKSDTQLIVEFLNDKQKEFNELKQRKCLIQTN